MTEDKQDELVRAYVTLSSLRKNIGEMEDHNVLETYVNAFHTVLDKVEGIELEVSEFRIPDSEVKPRVTDVGAVNYGGGGGGGHVTYSEEKYVDKSFILIKLDAILGYFEIITSEKPRKIGFHPPESQ